MIISDEVTVGHIVMLHNCTIGNHVLIGMGSIILDGAVIEDEVTISTKPGMVASGKHLHSSCLYILAVR
ncbi:hypothetical protein [Sodalis-like endosymbiont of Proechinophthirus fluctus]|uniref:hypothetical protein n=1 Tax=Sodalis-like endosymbiont of Proechinophthirus fluctus TaxID=1462730 RepID=UPI000AF77167